MYHNGEVKYSDANNARSRSWQFDDKVYIVDGKKLLVWDGSEVKPASEIAKIPTVTIAKSPNGGGTSYEDLNLIQSGFTELFAGTEPSIMGTETWTRKGMYFFPDTAFYEFITEKDMMRNYEDPSYIPPTYLMDEVRPGEKYELVFTILKGGAFARYRCGDMYRCVGLENREDETRIPRFEYVDRVPWIIDIAGFTRISENGIRSVIALSKLPIINWVATKEYNEQNRPYLHMYVELERDALLNTAMSTNILKDLLSTYFKYIDQDYRDLKKILGMDPLQVTIFTCGTFEAYEKKTGKKIHQMSPSHYELKELLDIQESLNRVR